MRIVTVRGLSWGSRICWQVLGGCKWEVRDKLGNGNEWIM